MMEEESHKFQRRTVLIKRGLQLKYATIVFASVVFTAMIVGMDIYYTMVQMIYQENPAMLSVVNQAARIAAVKMAVFLGIMFLVSLFVSHRFAGPIYRFERSAQTIATGDLTHRVSLRAGDDLMELQDEINAMVAGLQRLVQKDRTLVEHLSSRMEASLKKLPETLNAQTTERLREELKSLKLELEHITHSFKV